MLTSTENTTNSSVEERTCLSVGVNDTHGNVANLRHLAAIGATAQHTITTTLCVVDISNNDDNDNDHNNNIIIIIIIKRVLLKCR